MEPSQSKHFRIRDDNAYNVDVEEFIKRIETQYHIDFKSLPHWRDLTKRLHFMTTDFKRKLQDANLRKSLIIRKLFIESTRPTPFELSDIFARTGEKWETMKVKTKRRATSSKEEIENISSDSEETNDSDERVVGAAHPNTAVNTTVDTSANELSQENVILPTYICTNRHKLISPLASDNSNFLKSKSISIEIENKNMKDEWLILNHNKSIASSPIEIILKFDILEEQTIKFKLTNCTGEHLHVRFKNVTEKTQFNRAKVLPATPVILYPGVPVAYKFVFRLVERKKEFTSHLFFKVGRKVYADAPVEALCIPIISKFIKARSVSVPEIVSIPPIYFWHFENKYPKYPSAIVPVSVNDDRHYHLHIVKREVDLSKQTNAPADAIELLYDPSLEQEEASETSKEESVTKGKPKKRREAPKRDHQAKSSKAKETKARQEEVKRLQQIALEEVLKLYNDMASIAKDIVNLALNTFMFENTYLYLKPDSRKRIPVYLTEIEHIGCHNCYYEFEFIDPETEDVVITKTVRLFADVLPNPVQIQPEILLMSASHMIYGFGEDHFVITNKHRIIPATISFRLSTETKELIRIIPTGAVIPALSCVRFEVKFCSRDRKAVSEDLVHITFEVVVSGHKAIYRGAAPIIYEIIVPCLDELRNINKTKYYRDLMTTRAMKLT